MKFKAFLSILLAVCLTFTFCACGENTQSPQQDNETVSQTETSTKSRSYITLLYSSADSFNPYKVTSEVNRQITKLLYEPLVRISDSFQPVNALAKSIDLDGKVCRVTLRNAVFSDGTAVAADDVVYSYNAAKASNTAYAKQLYAVQSVTEEGSDTVVFTLTKSDPYFANVLDFPIIKKGSDTLTDSDSVSLPPVGAGRYRLNKSCDGLVINKKYYGKKGEIKKIVLINAPDYESVDHYTEIGAADMYFSDISDGTITRMSGKRAEINLNNLVYIGINQNYAPLNQKEMRQALSSAINRTKVCEEAFYNNALPAAGVFHPAWKETKSVQNLETAANNEITVENLEEIGYNRVNSQGIRINSNEITLQFTLLVNSENRIRVLAANTLATQLKAAGIGITVVEKPYKEYKADLKKGNFQLYLGEVKLTNNMDVSALFVKNGSAAYGLPKTTVTKKTAKGKTSTVKYKTTESQVVLSEFYKGKTTVKDVASVLQTDMAIVPVCYRTGVLFYNQEISNVNNSSFSDIYFSIDSYLIN